MKQKKILITGTSNGIGRAIALELANSLNHLILTWNKDIDGAKETSRLAEKKGSKTEIYNLNLEDEKEVSDFCDEINSLSGPDILINNAAIAQKKDFMELSNKDWDTVLSANLRAPFQLCQSFIPNMKENQWGRIVNISSIGGQWGGIHQVHYAASKAALINLTKSLAKIYSKDNISITSVAPGIIDTRMTRETLGHLPKDLLSQIPSGRLGTAQEVASTVKFLCSDEAAYLTGTTLNLNGGMHFNS